MRHVGIKTLVLLIVTVTTLSHSQPTTKSPISDRKTYVRRCNKPKDGQHLCFCGKQRLTYDLMKGEICRNERVISRSTGNSNQRRPTGLRLATKAIHQSTRDDNDHVAQCMQLQIKTQSTRISQQFVPLRNVSVEAWIDTFAADVTLTQVFVNQEENPIEAIYVFPVEENAAVYSFTAQIDNRTIIAVLKEKTTAEAEYQTAVSQGRTAVMMQQSKQTLDTFKVNVGSLPPGKECHITIKYVTELDLIDGNSIRFVVPTTIAPRYNPSLGNLQSPDNTKAQYVQKTPYSMWFQAHILRSDEYKIMQVANLSHPVNVRVLPRSIDVSADAIDLDRDIILDIDLPENRKTTIATIEKHPNSTSYAILLTFAPRLSDFIKISDTSTENNTEFIFIVDCSGSMTSDNRIGLAREAMLLFVRSLPLGSHFNIIRFGSNFDILFKNEMMTSVYNQTTAKQAEDLTRSMAADFGGTELLAPLKHLNDHPPIRGWSRQVLLLTDGEISNTDEVIELCRTMSSTTRIFSFGLGSSSSRSLVKGLARATNGHFVFVPPDSKVDIYVASQLGRALQPSFVGARLEWHGLSLNGSQSPKTIPPLYVNDRVLVYQLLEQVPTQQNITVDLLVGEHRLGRITLPENIVQKRNTIHRLAAKTLIQELQHEKQDTNTQNEVTLEQRIATLSLAHQILSPYTAFVGVETDGPTNNNTHSNVRHVPIQISKDDEHLFDQQAPMSYSGYSGGPVGSMPAIHWHYGSWRMAPQSNYQPPFPVHINRPQALGVHKWNTALITYDAVPLPTSTNRPFLASDPVRWLIDQQSFNGIWTLNEQDVFTLTNGKSLATINSTITQAKDVLTTALAIAVFELKYPDQKNLWFAVVDKGRKYLYRSGLSNDQVNVLIEQIKKQL